MVERLLAMQKVVGSNPISRSKKFYKIKGPDESSGLLFYNLFLEWIIGKRNVNSVQIFIRMIKIHLAQRA